MSVDNLLMDKINELNKHNKKLDYKLNKFNDLKKNELKYLKNKVRIDNMFYGSINYHLKRIEEISNFLNQTLYIADIK